jgi:asparagine synthetase B (glutamine-hydrolysing)
VLDALRARNGPDPSRRTASVISLSEGGVAGMLSDERTVREKFWDAARRHMPRRVDIGRCTLVSAAPIEAPSSEPLRLAIGSPAGVWAQAQRADSVVTMRIDRGGNAEVMRSWVGSVSLYVASTSGGLYFSTHIAPLVAADVPFSSIVTADPGCAYSASGPAVSWARRRIHTLTALPAPRDRALLVRRIRALVGKAVARIDGDGGVVMLSGGVDSTIAAYLLKRRIRGLEAIVMSVRDHAAENSAEASDLTMARRAARWLGLKLHEVVLSPDSVARVAPDVIRTAETRRASIVDELSGMYHVAQRLRCLGVSTVYSGEGPDDIFGGLEFELRFTPMHRLHAKMRNTFRGDLPLELAAQQKVFTEFGLRVVHPLLFRPLVRLGLGIPSRVLIDRQRRMKVPFRQAFSGEIPDEFLWRPKAITRMATGLKAAQERRFGRAPTRYYAMFSMWLASLRR